MGCDESTPAGGQKPPVQAAVLFNQYNLMRLITPQCVFENDLERDIFMAINVCRYATGTFVEVVQAVKANNPLCRNAKYTDKLLKLLSLNERLPEVVYDVAAFDACRENNRI